MRHRQPNAAQACVKSSGRAVVGAFTGVVESKD
jgi:hypothetical protein